MIINNTVPIKFMLPFDDTPKLESHFNITFLYSIISANIGDNYYPWICNQYVNCALDSESENVKFLLPEDDNGSMNINLTSYQFIELTSKTYTDVIDIPLLFKNIISSGYYINGSFCAKIISDQYLCRTASGKGDYLVTGYNDTEKIFVLKGFDREHKLKTFTVPYELYISALLAIPRDVIRLHIWNFNKTEIIEVDKTKLATQLSAYISSSAGDSCSSSNKIYGINAIIKLCDIIESKARTQGFIEELFIKNIFEHKWFMFERVKYLTDIGSVSNSHLLGAKRVYDLIMEAYVYTKEYNKTENAAILEKVILCIRDIFEIERGYIPTLINELIKKSLF